MSKKIIMIFSLCFALALIFTEQVYLELMQEYGSVGYLNNTGDFKANEIVINSWKLLSMY